MIYIYTDPACPEQSRAFLYHLPTHTLAEHFVTLAGNHHLRVHQDEAADTDALLDIMEFIEKRAGFPRIHLSSMSGKVDYAILPPRLVLVSATGEKSAIIHYPELGFTAGVHQDGTKIPPYWRKPGILTPEQRSHFLHNAADALMQAIAQYGK